MKTLLSKRSITLYVLLLIIGGQYWYVRGVKQQLRQTTEVAQERGWEVVKWRNDAGNSQARIRALETSKKTLKAFYSDWLDSVGTQLKIKTKKLESLTEIETTNARIFTLPLRDTVEKRITLPGDTVYHPIQRFKYVDRWSDIAGIIRDGEITLTPQSRDSLTLAVHRRRARFWKKDYLYAEAVSHNPHSSIVGLKHWKKAVKPRRFGLGAGVGYDPFLQRITLSVNLNYDFIQF